MFLHVLFWKHVLNNWPHKSVWSCLLCTRCGQRHLQSTSIWRSVSSDKQKHDNLPLLPKVKGLTKRYLLWKCCTPCHGVSRKWCHPGFLPKQVKGLQDVCFERRKHILQFSLGLVTPRLGPRTQRLYRDLEGWSLQLWVQCLMVTRSCKRAYALWCGHLSEQTQGRCLLWPQEEVIWPCHDLGETRGCFIKTGVQNLVSSFFFVNV